MKFWYMELFVNDRDDLYTLSDMYCAIAHPPKHHAIAHSSHSRTNILSYNRRTL